MLCVCDSSAQNARSKKLAAVCAAGIGGVGRKGGGARLFQRGVASKALQKQHYGTQLSRISCYQKFSAFKCECIGCLGFFEGFCGPLYWEEMGKETSKETSKGTSLDLTSLVSIT